METRLMVDEFLNTQYIAQKNKVTNLSSLWKRDMKIVWSLHYSNPESAVKASEQCPPLRSQVQILGSL